MAYIVIIVYSLSLLLIFLFSMAQLHLAWNYIRSRNKKSTKDLVYQDNYHPTVTVQLPVFNEKYVVGRLIDAVTKLKYPKEKLEIQILDDSTDETTDIIRKKVAHYSEEGYNIQLIRRNDRKGFKAGALENGLEESYGDLIAVFDADFLADPDFLLNTVNHFADPGIGLVQTRWGHLNKEYSFLTRLQAFGLDAHFTVEQTGRANAGSFISFNGTAGIWRKHCIVDAGGWSADTLTEDLDLSYRAQMKGWKFKYLESVVSPAELPVIMSAIKTQQYRWNKGAAETAVKNLGKVLKMPLKTTTKVHALFHLLNSSIYIPLLVAAILSIPMLFIKNRYSEFDILFNLGSVFLIGFFSIGYFYWVSVKNSKSTLSLGHFIKVFPMFLAMSMGMSLHNALAAVEGLFGFKSPFIRTPKFNIVSNYDSWEKNIYISNKFNLLTVLEGILGLYFIAGIIYAFVIQDFALIFFHLFLSLGFILVFLHSLHPLKYARS